MGNTSKKLTLLAAAGVLALSVGACGKDKKSKAESPKVSKETAKMMTGASPLEKSYSYKGGKELDVTAFLSTMSDGASDNKFTVKSSKYDKKKGATVLTDFVSTDPGNSFKIGKLELYGVNEANIKRIKAKEDVTELLPVFDRVRAFDVTISPPAKAMPAEGAPAQSITIGAIEFRELKIHPLNDEKMNALSGDGAQFAAVMKSIDFGGMNIQNLKMVGFEQGGSGIDMSVADMRIGNIGQGVIGPVSMTDFDYTVKQSAEVKQAVASANPQMGMLLNGPLGNMIMPGNARAKGESMSWGGMSITGWLPYLEKGETPPANAKNLVSFGAIEAKNFSSYVNGKLAAETKLSTVDPIEFAWLVPTKINAYNKGQKIHLAAYVPEGQEAMMKVLDDAGVKTATGDSSVTWTYNQKKGDADFNYTANMDGLADISLKFAGTGAPLQPILAAKEARTKALTSGDTAPAELKTGMEKAAFEGFSLEIKDEKLLDVVFGIAGLQMGQDAAQVRQMAPAFLAMGGAQLQAVTPKANDYIASVSKFLTEGGSLKIAMAPKKPVLLKTLEETGKDPAAALEKLNLTVVHSK